MSKLYIVGTPIGNLSDITYRAIEVLSSVDLIACEDTRHTRILLDKYNIHCPLYSYYKQKEKEGTEELIRYLDNGKTIALVTDAGMPCISDPGAVLIKELIARGYEVESVPGPTAVTTAMSISGIISNGFTFLGFLPEKKKDKLALLTPHVNSNVPLVFYCAPHDLEKTIAFLHETLGNRTLTSVKELTKLHETVYKGTLETPNIDNERGEFVLIVEPQETPSKEDVDIKEELKTLLSNGMSRSQAVKELAKRYNLNKNDVYAISLTID